jgi:hypothetical protein
MSWWNKKWCTLCHDVCKLWLHLCKLSDFLCKESDFLHRKWYSWCKEWHFLCKESDFLCKESNFLHKVSDNLCKWWHILYKTCCSLDTNKSKVFKKIRVFETICWRHEKIKLANKNIFVNPRHEKWFYPNSSWVFLPRGFDIKKYKKIPSPKIYLFLHNSSTKKYAFKYK